MNITSTAIKYHITVVVLTIMLIFGGLYSYTTIPKESTPSIEIPNIVVTTIFPGASPDDIESLVTQHIEREIQNISGIKEIRSTSTEGVSSVVVEFEPDVALDKAYSRVRDKVDVAKAKLPTETEEPSVTEIDVSDFPILTVNLSAPFSLTRLKKIAEDLEDDLEAIPSVLAVDLSGGLDREVQVNADLSALQGYNLSFKDLLDTIRDENTNIPGGSVDVDDLNFLVRIDGEFEVPAEIENLVVSTKNGVPIYVRDVADVDFGFKDRDSYARLAIFKTEDDDGTLRKSEGDDAAILSVISLNVKKRSGENILETVAEANKVIADFPFASGMKVVTTGDQSVFVETLIRDLENNIIGGLIFVVAVLLFFLGLRNAILVGIAIPISMLLSFTVFQALGYTLNFIILFSMIIALGMLVDNAIVIVENIYRFREEGHSRFEAARLGTGEVSGAVIASTATTVAVFIPMLFWPGVIGEFMGYMPLTLIITLLSSLFVALIINPVLTGMFIRLTREEKPNSRPAIVSRLVMGVGALILLIIGLTNWKMLVVIVVGIPSLVLLHSKALKPVADRFSHQTLPRVIAGYREMLNGMLSRDYSVPRAVLRNTFALGIFTLGFIVLAGSVLLSSIASASAAMVLLIPGILLLGMGVIAIAIHTIEVVYLGGKRSVRAGIYFGFASAILLGLMSLGSVDVPLSTVVDLMILPVLVVLIGLAGSAFNDRSYLILTDNRARLLNGSLGALLAIIVMYSLAPTGVVFFPDTDPHQVRVNIAGPLGMNVESSNNLASIAQQRISALLADHRESEENLKNMLINVGVGDDNNFSSGASSPERSRITLNMVDYKYRSEPSNATLTRIRDQLQGIPGAEIKVTKDSQGPPTGSPVNIEISGSDFTAIRSIAQNIKEKLLRASENGTIPGLVDISDNLNSGRPELKVKIDRVRAAQFNLSTRKIATTVRSAINGVEAGKYREGDDEYDITVRLRASDRENLESLNNLTILEDGVQIPLVSVAELEMSSGLGSITRLDLNRVATVSGEAAAGYNGQAILTSVQELLSGYVASLPPGYQISYTGENEEQQKSFAFLTIAFLIGISLIFMIMVAQFNRVISPFIIMVAVGLSLIGVILGLVLTRTPFGLMTFIGVISLAGIVVNNNIVLIDYTMQLQDRGFNKHAAIVEAGATRFRPVVLTALTTVIGLIPLTFGINIDFVGLLTDLNPDFQFGSENTQFWGPMGSSIIAGLTFATFLTLIIVPVMYSAFDSLATRLNLLFRPSTGQGTDSQPFDESGHFPTSPIDISATDAGNGYHQDVGDPAS